MWGMAAQLGRSSFLRKHPEQNNGDAAGEGVVRNDYTLRPADTIAINSHSAIFTAMRGNLLWVGYILGVAMLVMGILILSGFFQLRGTEAGQMSLMQTVFGVVLLLYGIYRLVMTDMQRKRAEREEGGNNR